MAHCVSIEEECSEDGCHARATVEVRNRRNEPIRRCCRRHGDALVVRLNASGD